MRSIKDLLFFDKNDYQLLKIVNDVLVRGEQSQARHSLLDGYLHPHGINEMAAPRGLRIAYEVASLLGSLDKGHAGDRISALRSLRDEVLFSSSSFYQKNTARVLIQIMKNLLRSGDNKLRQLKLAHDFRMVSAGNPRRVRAELVRYHLLEMPEEWNQYAFDDHVHDANTKGRKSPTHLVMDAWIKGIRHLTVVYYNYVAPEVVEELLEASSILDVNVQVGIEMLSKFRSKYVRFVWVPKGFIDNQTFLKFFKENMVTEVMDLGRKVSDYQQKYVFEVLKAFNNRHRLDLNDELQISMDPLELEDFVKFVGSGQPSVLHLSRFILNAFYQHFEKMEAENSDTSQRVNSENSIPLNRAYQEVHGLSIDRIIEKILSPSANPDIFNPYEPQNESDLPQLLRLKPKELLKKLQSLQIASTFTLNLSNLTIQDTMELLFECEGMISHIETYNLKDANHGMTTGTDRSDGGGSGGAVNIRSPEKFYRLIGKLQRALSEDNVINLKSVIRLIITDYEEQVQGEKRYLDNLPPEKAERKKIEQDYQQMLLRKKMLLEILSNLEVFYKYYQNRTVGSRIGSGSTGQGGHQHGMGMVVLDTLPARARRVVKDELSGKRRTAIPVFADLTYHSYRRDPAQENAPEKGFFGRLWKFGKKKKSTRNDWILNGFTVHPDTSGNIVSLGGMTMENGFVQFLLKTHQGEKLGNPWKYLNTNLKNSLKVLFGLIPAFLTFYLTKDWWLLAYFGAFIWFGITGVRNIIQSVLGGGGVSRSPLLPWNSLVSWSRVADSLLYTGFSVPLLDYLVKTKLLDDTFGVTTSTDPIVLYAVMGLANGIYISSHNIVRGLPKAAAAGNFFRSILAIPLAIALNSLTGSLLVFSGVGDVTGILQKWAAIISKLASDCVAAVIEGLADRQTNVQARLKAYRTKISQLFTVFSRLDLCFPEKDVLDMLQSPKNVIENLNNGFKNHEALLIVNALDLMYFWMYQPRARKAVGIILENMTQEEWLIFYRSQLVLDRHREISQCFVDGLVGKNFGKALAFYLERSEQYLLELENMGKTKVKL